MYMSKCITMEVIHLFLSLLRQFDYPVFFFKLFHYLLFKLSLGKRIMETASLTFLGYWRGFTSQFSIAQVVTRHGRIPVRVCTKIHERDSKMEIKEDQ